MLQISCALVHAHGRSVPMCLPVCSAGSYAAAAAVASTCAGSDDGSEGANNVTPSILRKTATSYKPGDGASVPWRPPGPDNCSRRCPA